MNLLSLLLPALLPAVTDGIRGVIGRFTMGAGAQPQNVEERIKLMQAEAAKLQALAALDQPGAGVAAWVQNFRASFRYFAISGVIAATLAGAYVGLDPAVMAVMLDLTGACMSFIIGERMYLQLKR